MHTKIVGKHAWTLCCPLFWWLSIRLSTWFRELLPMHSVVCITMYRCTQLLNRSWMSVHWLFSWWRTSGWKEKTLHSNKENSMCLHSLPCLVCISWFPPDISWCSSSVLKQLLFRWQHWLPSINTVTTLPKQVPNTFWQLFSPVHCCCLVCPWSMVLPGLFISMTSLPISTEIRYRSWHLYSSSQEWHSSCHWFRSTYGQQTFTKALRVQLPLIWVLYQKDRLHLYYWPSLSKYSLQWLMTGRKYFIG